MLPLERRRLHPRGEDPVTGTLVLTGIGLSLTIACLLLTLYLIAATLVDFWREDCAPRLKR
jgi:hypothetical protein